MGELLDQAIAEGVIDNVPHRGLPRERTAEGLPIPFAVKQRAGDVAWAEVDSRLTMLVTLDGRCHMCGELLPDEEAFAFVDMMGRVVDGWVMHQRCARLARAHCPYLAKALNDHMFMDRAGELVAALRDETTRKATNDG